MESYIQEGERLDLIAPYDVLSGKGFLVANIFAVAISDALNGAAVVGQVAGVVELIKETTDNATAGIRMYWDDTEKRLTVDAVGNQLVGLCVEAAGTSATSCKILLMGGAEPKVAAIVAYTAGTNLSGVDGTGSNAAPLTGTETRLDAIDIAIAAIITSLKNAGVMASS